MCALVPATLALPQQPAWHIAGQTTRNETTRLLTTTSADTYPATDGSYKRVILQMQCSGHLTGSITLSADDTFAVKSDATSTLSIRLDGDTPLHAGWANLSPHRILLYDLRDLLPSHHRMTIDLPLGDARPQTLAFDLSMLGSVMHDNNCRRRLQ